MNAIEDLAIQFALDLFIFFYVGFFAIHAAQHVADPIQRAGWLMLIVLFNILGTTLYLFTKYRKFKAIGKGGWIVAKRWKWDSFKNNDYWSSLKEYFFLSDAEKLQF